jgi:hypothetical protein
LYSKAFTGRAKRHHQCLRNIQQPPVPTT